MAIDPDVQLLLDGINGRIDGLTRPTGVFYVDPGQSIQNALNAAKSADGGDVVLALGTHTINRPLEMLNQRVRLKGPGMTGCWIVAGPSWSGGQMIRNWPGSDLFPSSNSTNFYPQISGIILNLGGQDNLTGIGLVHPNERGLIEQISMDNPGVGCVGIDIGRAVNAMDGCTIRDIVLYGTGWEHELRAAHGTDLRVSGWTTAPSLHTGSPFELNNGISQASFTDMHVESWVDAADTALFRLTNSRGFVLRDSLVSMNVPYSRPIVRATNSNGSGYNVSNPVIADLLILGYDNLTATNLIEDESQGYDIRNLATADYTPTYIDRYDGFEFKWREPDWSGLADVANPRWVSFRGAG